MASLTTQRPLSTPVDQWITPQEQLRRLALSIAKEQVYTNGLGELPVERTSTVTESLARSILRRSYLSSSGSEIPSLQDLAVERLIEPSPLPFVLTNWYIARKRLNILPEKIPPLPENITQILNSKCSIYGDQIKEDGTHPRVGETHFLQLICQEDGSLIQFIDVLRAYYLNEKERFWILNFSTITRREHGNVPFKSHWELITKDVIPGSQKKTYNQQIAIVEALAQKSFVNYEVPSLKSMSPALLLHTVATRDLLYKVGRTYSRVQEVAEGYHLVVVGPGPPNSTFSYYIGDQINQERIGVGACRRF
jgi:hypothetical protein